VFVDENVLPAANGDLAAFERIYQTYYRVVYSRCLRMTRSVAEAEDLTQDVFIQVFRKLKTFRGESSFSTWLHRLTVNAVLMHFRKPRLKYEQTSLDDSAPDQCVSGNESYNKLSIVDRIALNEAIRQLSPGYRAVLILHDVEGYEHSEISEMLGCAVGTSKSQLHKARMKLRRLLKKQAPSKGESDARLRWLKLHSQPLAS
jgi:RNA polymerase sigma-70 factor (ECF subfamily)